MLGPKKTVFSQSVGRTFRLCRFAQYGIISILQIRKELSVFLKKKEKKVTASLLCLDCQVLFVLPGPLQYSCLIFLRI